jgi:DNA-binding beta-propeller fold protein YncE
MKYIKLDIVFVIIISFFAIFVEISCTSNRQIETRLEHSENLVWPPAPSVSRIKYLGSLHQPDDLGINEGLFGLLKAAAIGKEDNSMILPMAIAVNDDELFVSDPGKKGIHRFDTKRGKYKLIKRTGGKDFTSPVGMAVDEQGNILVADSELAKVFIIKSDSDYATPLALEEDFVRPTGIAVDKETGWIYVVDTGIHAIYVFKKNRSLVKKIGGRGLSDGELNYPTYIWLNKAGQLLVTDSLNFRIQVFNNYGEYLKSFGKAGNGTGDLARPKGVAEDSDRHIYVADSLFHNVQVFDESGKYLLSFGEQGQGPGQFWLPVGLTITEDDKIYVADSYNKRVQIFQYIRSKP